MVEHGGGERGGSVVVVLRNSLLTESLEELVLIDGDGRHCEQKNQPYGPDNSVEVMCHSMFGGDDSI